MYLKQVLVGSLEAQVLAEAYLGREVTIIWEVIVELGRLHFDVDVGDIKLDVEARGSLLLVLSPPNCVDSSSDVGLH